MQARTKTEQVGEVFDRLAALEDRVDKVLRLVELNRELLDYFGPEISTHATMVEVLAEAADEAGWVAPKVTATGWSYPVRGS